MREKNHDGALATQAEAAKLEAEATAAKKVAKKAEADADVAERAAARARSSALKEFKLSTTARIEAVDAKADALRKAKVAAGAVRTHMVKNAHFAL